MLQRFFLMERPAVSIRFPVLALGAALLIAGCSGGSSGTAVPASSNAAMQSSVAGQSATSAAPQSTSKTADTGPAARYEAYLHATGREDVTTVCEIAGPAAKKAQDQGFGPCEKTIPITFQMFSPAQKKALLTATVNRSQVKWGVKQVEIPARAVQAAVKFTDSDLGDAVLENRGGTWYVVD